MGNSRMQSNTRHLFLYRRTRVLANSSFYHFTFEMNQTHVKEHIYYYSLESREYSIPIFIICSFYVNTWFYICGTECTETF